MRVRGTLALLLLLGVGSTARAQNAWDPPSSTGFRLRPRTGGEIDVGFFTDERGTYDFHVVNGLLRTAVLIPMSEGSEGTDPLSNEDLVSVETGAVAGWRWGDIQGYGRPDETFFSNPYVYAGAVFGAATWRVRAGMGVSAPPYVGEYNFDILDYTAASRGFSEIWLWAHNQVTVVPYAVIEAMPIELFYIEASLRPAFMIEVVEYPTAPFASARTVDFLLEGALALGFRAEYFFAGLRLRALWTPTLSSYRPEVYGAPEIFVHAAIDVPQERGLHVFFESRFRVNLDEVHGLSCREPFPPCTLVWGTFFSIGAGALPFDG